MKTIACILLFGTSAIMTKAQSIVGEWQLIKETNCMDDQLADASEAETELLAEMKTRTPAAANVVTFKDKMEGEETTRILTRRKPSNKTKFLYKFNGEALWILDKRSQTITERFVVEKISADSLILSSSARPCEIRIFLRLK